MTKVVSVFATLLFILIQNALASDENCQKILNPVELIDHNVFAKADKDEKALMSEVAKSLLQKGSPHTEEEPNLDNRVMDSVRLLELAGTPKSEVALLVKMRIMDHLLLPLSEGLGFKSNFVDFASLAHSLTSPPHGRRFVERYLSRDFDIFNETLNIHVESKNPVHNAELGFKNAEGIAKALHVFHDHVERYQVWLEVIIPVSLRYNLKDLSTKAIGINLALGRYQEVTNAVIRTNPHQYPERNDVLLVTGKFALMDYFTGVHHEARFSEFRLSAAILALGAVEGKYKNYSRALLRELFKELILPGHRDLIESVPLHRDRIDTSGGLLEQIMKALRYSEDFQTAAKINPELSQDLKNDALAIFQGFASNYRTQLRLLDVIRTGDTKRYIKSNLFETLRKLNRGTLSSINFDLLEPNLRGACVVEAAGEVDYASLIKMTKAWIQKDAVMARFALLAAILVRENRSYGEIVE